MIQTLDERNIELSKILYTLKQSIDLEKILGLNADTINKQGCGKRFFAHIQMITIEVCVMYIWKIFEKEKREYSLNSIPAIISFIKENKVQPKGDGAITEFISKYGPHIKNKNGYITILENIYEDFYEKHKISFERYGYARNKVFAHAEYKAQVNSLPSHTVMKELLLFGVDFYYMICRAYINVGPHPIHEDKQILKSASGLLKMLGIKDVKTEFDR